MPIWSIIGIVLCFLETFTDKDKKKITVADLVLDLFGGAFLGPLAIFLFVGRLRTKRS